ncbi:hypothetical protein CF328_g6522 [Tilletia controversa]|nr:hypothetical protein CF328_g6522 [Tilletia controversa]
MAGHDESPIKPARFRPAAGRGRGAVHDPTSDAPGLESRFGDWEPAGDEEDTYGEEDDELDDYLENGEDSEEEEDNEFGSPSEEDEHEEERAGLGKRQRNQEGPRKRARLPPLLYQAAGRYKLSKDCVKMFEEEIAEYISFENKIPSATMLYKTAREMKTYQNSETIQAEVQVLCSKVDELTELVERLAKDTVKLTKSDLTELAKAIAYCFYSEHAFLKANPRAVSDDFKEHFDNAEVRRKEVQPAVRAIITRLRGACGDRIHASMGIDSGTKKMTLYELWSYLCKGYGVPFTKQRAYRIALMRFVASEKPVRHKDGRPTGKFWRTLDATIADMQQRQGEDAAGVKEDLQNIYEADMETYGTRDDVEFSKGGSKEDALKTAMTARSD